MSAEDEPVFEANETGEHGLGVNVPADGMWIGALPEDEVPGDYPTIYMDWAVAAKLQEEAQRSTREDREVAGILLGTTSADSQIIKVSHIAVAKDEDSSPVHFKFTYSVWDDLIDQMGDMSLEAGEDLQLVCWYHTHPNMSVFLSRYDLRTHRDFHRPHQFALVLAPQSGTEQTQVGFFVNRGGGTPLLPGVRLYGAPGRTEVAGKLPWRFQVIEAEGVYEGEADEEADETADERDETPVTHQLGLVKGEAPDWLVLGDDPGEGHVLPILEGMAGSVVANRGDRVGVLLGSKTPDNHITITRVRFLGVLDEDPATERRQLLEALRFMAETFPADGAQPILGVVRIVSPHRFSAGDRYDPTEHNIRIARLLAEVDYDLDAVPFQVGIVLYPGIEEDVLFFQAFAQYKSSPPLPKTSLQAIAPTWMEPNERYEPVAEVVFEIEQDPCGIAPALVPPPEVAAPPPPPPPPEPPLLPPTGAQSGADWESVTEDVAPEQRSGLPLVALLLAGLAAVVALLVVLKLLGGGVEPEERTTVEDQAQAGADLVAELGEPYRYSLVGCGEGWNPGVPCAPFAGAEDEAVELVRVQREEAYVRATIEPIEVWLLPTDSARPRQHLERAALGDGLYGFSVARVAGTWPTTWGSAEEPFEGQLVVLPRGAELTQEDEWTPLRRTERVRLVGPPPPPEEVEEVEAAGAPAPRARRGAWLWSSGAAITGATWDLERRAFAEPLAASGGVDPAGKWSFAALSSRRSRAVASSTSDELTLGRSGVELGAALTRLMRQPAVVELLEGEKPARSLTVRITAPDRSRLDLQVATTGEAGARGVQHRICVMLTDGEGKKVEGQAGMPRGGAPLRQTFDPAAKGCSDGGNSQRWLSATFGPGPAEMEWIYLDTLETAQAKHGKAQKVRLPERWSRGAPRCLAVTLTVDSLGTLSASPKMQPLYDVIDGRCQ